MPQDSPVTQVSASLLVGGFLLSSRALTCAEGTSGHLPTGKGENPVPSKILLVKIPICAMCHNFAKSTDMGPIISTRVCRVREVLHGVGADGVGVKFPFFCSKLQLFALVL